MTAVAIRAGARDDERAALVRSHLDLLREEYGAEFRDRDPVQFPHRYATKVDREVAALLSAILAFGQVEVVLRNLRDVFGRLGPRPSAAVRELDGKGAAKLARGFRHRWIGAAELARLLGHGWPDARGA